MAIPLISFKTFTEINNPLKEEREEKTPSPPVHANSPASTEEPHTTYDDDIPCIKTYCVEEFKKIVRSLFMSGSSDLLDLEKPGSLDWMDLINFHDYTVYRLNGRKDPIRFFELLAGRKYRLLRRLSEPSSSPESYKDLY